jgi:glycosyltransferase involved in cell wall biosynthesis
MAKVVYDHQVFGWQKYGGISRYIYELATQLDKSEELEVKILAIAYVNEYLKKCNPNLVTGFSVPYVPSKQLLNLLRKFNNEISNILLKYNSPDIIHTTYYYPNYLKVENSPIVVTVHDMTHEKLSQFFNHKDIFKIQDNTSLAKQECVKKADRIICVSENTKNDLIEIFDVEPSQISVIYHGYSLTAQENPQLEVDIPEPYIFYVGDRGGYKNFQRLLQAYASSSNLRNNCCIVCFGGGVLSPDERRQINALGLPESKVLQVSGNDVALANFYRNASVFVYPSLYEGFGIPLLEAMALHCPVSCSNTSSMPEVVGDAAELFNPYEPESIAEALEKILFSTTISDKLVKLGTERIKHFSWEICAEQTKQVYLSLL